ncbi:hypothetical protein [Sphingomonas sp. 28-63-12]|uniref:hypothetical protein n=1 Tax=Sphingomonas sp. 28-63-12 TaxID=1970434 RepID=UPI000BD89152|nr:MAG: hypothetical protein B7Y47_07165 [Sphingomonas sp. 28-63-12]
MLTSATANAGAQTVTSISFVLIAIGIVCALAIILWGAMRRRTKAHEVAEAERHAARAGHSPDIIDPDAPVVPPVAAVAVAEPKAVPAPTPAVPLAPAAPVAAPVVAAGDAPSLPRAAALPVTVLKGLGPKAAARLAELGITTVDQLAGLNAARVAAIDAQMGSFVGRIGRDRWIEQARLLAADDMAGFEAAFGKLGG